MTRPPDRLSRGRRRSPGRNLFDSEHFLVAFYQRLERWPRMNPPEVSRELRPLGRVGSHPGEEQIDELRSDTDIADGQAVADEKIALQFAFKVAEHRWQLFLLGLAKQRLVELQLHQRGP